MGAVHKLKPEIYSFILESKQQNPAVSCRNLAHLVFEKFQIKVSKSSINAIFKTNNLSMPIGRRLKARKKKFNLPVLPVIEASKAVTVGVPLTPKEVISPVIQTSQPPVEQEKDKLSGEEKRISEAEAWAIKLQEEERQRVEQKLSQEKQRIKDEQAQLKGQEAAVVADLAAAAKAAEQEEQKKRLAQEAQAAATEKQRLADLACQQAKEQERLLELERLAQQEAEAEQERRRQEQLLLQDQEAQKQAELIAEKEKWARLAEAEQAAKAQAEEKEIILPKAQAPEVEVLPRRRDCSGAILLKALDCLIGGSQEINAAISQALSISAAENLPLTEALVFKSLFPRDNLSALGDLVGVKYSAEKISSYSSAVKQIKGMGLETAKIIANVFTLVKGARVNFSDASAIHLDGQLHSSWATSKFPAVFSTTVNDLKNNLNKDLIGSGRLILFSAPGYDVLPKDFFTLISNFAGNNQPVSLTLFGNESEELENIPLGAEQKYSLVFGLWPWQFNSCRKVKRIGEFFAKIIPGLERNLYLAEIEIDLLRPALNQTISLKGCAIKTGPAEKICLVILNTASSDLSLEDLAEAYLKRWPNFDEAFLDFSRKIELFTYAGSKQKVLAQDRFQISTQLLDLESNDLFANYIQMLDLYLRWHFLPAEYTEKDLTFTGQTFYRLAATLLPEEDKLLIRLQAQTEYPFLKDLEYLLRRMNERQMCLADQTRIYFERVGK